MEPDVDLCQLYRQRRLTAAELAKRLHTLDDLASGKLRPTIAPLLIRLAVWAAPRLTPKPVADYTWRQALED